MYHLDQGFVFHHVAEIDTREESKAAMENNEPPRRLEVI